MERKVVILLNFVVKSKNNVKDIKIIIKWGEGKESTKVTIEKTEGILLS